MSSSELVKLRVEEDTPHRGKEIRYPKEFAVIDITTKSRQTLNVQGLKDNMLSLNGDITFLENGDLAIAKPDSVFRAYIFSKLKFNGKYQWTCKNSIELEKNDSNRYNKCKINKNGTLFIYFLKPHVITQWNLITRKFEMQYILNSNLRLQLCYNRFEMNSDNTLLAITFYIKSRGRAVYVYSTISGIEIANKTFSESFSLHKFCFIGSKEKERLFISFWNGKTKNYIIYILNPLTHTFDESPDTNILHDILSQNYEVINDYIIKIDKNELSIKRLSQNENWKNHLQSKERYVDSIFFNTKEIKQFILSILERYKSNQFLTQSYSDVSKEYPGVACTWIVTNKYNEYNKHSDTTLKAQIKSNLTETSAANFNSNDSADSYNLEIKVLKNDDIIFVSSSGIRIFSVNSEKNSIELIYFWKEDIQKISTQKAQQSINKHLISFKNKLDIDIVILPAPIFGIWVNCFDTLKNNEIALKLYGKEILQHSGRKTNLHNETNVILDDCYKYSISMFENGDINNFLLFISQIAFALVELEKYNKNLKATENFLLKINLLIINDIYIKYINDYSLLSHLQYYGIYVHSYLSNTSFFDYLLFWISENWSLLKNNYPKIYKILKSPYLFYLSYFTIYPQKTIRLMFPLLNFATYSQNYSYNELFSLYNNSFTSLDISDYYKWWNIKALINFKWNTYGKLYYFLIWIIYSIFMYCFLIVSTISKSEISWNNQVILLIITIFLGFIHFIFEVRQFIHKPMHYITSSWNWFDLAAILFPTITSIIWIYDITIPVWIITISVFLLEIKFLLFFRVLQYFGTYFAIMIGVAQKIFSFLVVLGILVLAFAHSLHILLRPTTKYSYNQPSYTDDSNNPWNLVSTYQFISSNSTVEGSSLVEIPDDNTNMFALFSTSLLAVYFMLTGDSSAVSSWVYKNNWMLVFLMVIFSFFTTIYLLNLFITLLGAAVDETNNEESFLHLKCEILSEIELFWMLPYQRRKKNWFLDILYYEASVHELKKYLKKSTEDEEIFENLLPSVKKKLQDLFPEIKELTEIKYSNKEIKDSKEEIKDTIKAQKDELVNDLKAQIDKSLKAQIDESLKAQIDELLKTQKDESLKDLKAQMDESLKNLKDQIDESLKDKLKAQIDESLADRLKIQIDEALKDPIDKFNKLIEFIEKKESE
ncbi:transient receptor potential cation channel subfamily a member 1-like [Gigaspora margarita]|uniref:Transient receptor potential cation channel subfamily a member 1-like n=1 Tax=Gigaspora margarita TaxID=4874 RepID=A0A8H4AQM1_GIGMA|nr:transient receptor potential cation channel subfamily a member 1-like [Gigaspora margarita]